MTDEEKIDLDNLVDKTPLTLGEKIRILILLAILALTVFMYFKTTCTLDCSMCTSATETLTQTGWL